MDNMDDDIKTVFLVLCLFFPTFTCLGYCAINFYMRRKGGFVTRRHDLSAARTRLQLQEIREQISRRQEQKINDPLRLEQIEEALNFETLRLPSAEPLKDHQDGEKDTADGSTVPEYCQCCEEKKDDNDDDANGVDVEQNAIPSSTSSQNRMFSSSSMTKGGGHNNSAFTSILAMLVQPWTEGDGDDDLENCCSICLESYQSGQVICSPKFPDCDHVFHEACAMQWFKKSDECPLCRSNIITTSLQGKKETVY